MATLPSLLTGKKKIIFFALGFVLFAGVGAWLIFSSSGTEDTTGIVEEIPSQDKQATSEAEQLAIDIQKKLDFFSQKETIDFFERHDDLIPIYVELSELAAENPFEGASALQPSQPEGGEEVIVEEPVATTEE
jgi:hypothetical protein